MARVDIDKMTTDDESPSNPTAEEKLPEAMRSQFPYKVRESRLCYEHVTLDPKLPATSNLSRFFLIYILPTVQLHRILDDASELGFDDIITWMPHGKSFRVFSKERLEEEVMARYFDSNKFKTFQRNLNLWGFQVGENKEIAQEFFIRGRRDLCKQMQRVKVKGVYVRGTRSCSANRNAPSKASAGHHNHHGQPSACAGNIPPDMNVFGTPKVPMPSSASTGPWQMLQRHFGAPGNACHHRSNQESLLNLIVSANQDTRFSSNTGLVNGQYDQQQRNVVQTAALMAIISSERSPNNFQTPATQLQSNHQDLAVSLFSLLPRPRENSLLEAVKLKILLDHLQSNGSTLSAAPVRPEPHIAALVRALISHT